MAEARRPLSALTRVDAGEVLLRLVAGRDFLIERPLGERVLPAALQTHDFTPSPTSYGASVYIESLVPSGVEVKVQLGKPNHLVATLAVAALNALGIEVVLTPEDCDDEVLRPAHASLIGVTKANRPTILRLIDQGLPHP